jgi:hypothetical protein
MRERPEPHFGNILQLIEQDPGTPERPAICPNWSSSIKGAAYTVLKIWSKGPFSALLGCLRLVIDIPSMRWNDLIEERSLVGLAFKYTRL